MILRHTWTLNSLSSPLNLIVFQDKFFINIHEERFCLTFFQLIFYITSRTYKWIGNCLLKLQNFSEHSRNARLPPRSYHSPFFIALLSTGIFHETSDAYFLVVIYTSLCISCSVCVYTFSKDRIYLCIMIYLVYNMVMGENEMQKQMFGCCFLKAYNYGSVSKVTSKKTIIPSDRETND